MYEMELIIKWFYFFKSYKKHMAWNQKKASQKCANIHG